MSELEKPGVFARWSRRKRQSEDENRAEDELLEQRRRESDPLTASPEVEPLAGSGETASTAEAPVLTDADMPPLDSLDQDSDFSLFMSPGVSDTLRKLALKKLFHGAEFNLRDGLDEYDEDFTSFEKLGDIITADMRHQLELEAERQAELDAVDDEDAVEEDIDDEQAVGAGEAQTEPATPIKTGPNEIPQPHSETNPEQTGLPQ